MLTGDLPTTPTSDLSKDLAHLVNLLTLRMYGGPEAGVDAELRESVNAFVERFAEHLSEQELEYLPDLEAAMTPDRARKVEHLRRDHLQLWAYASRMRRAVEENRPQEAHAWARKFLCCLLRHTLCQQEIADAVAGERDPGDNP